MRLVTATPNATYADTDQVLTTEACALLKSRGIRGVFRYLSGLSSLERDIILASGLELYFVNYAHAAGWRPSAVSGALDAARDLDRLARLAIPVGAHVAFDLEGPSAVVTPDSLSPAASVIAHVTAHALAIAKANYLPALYVGEGSLLTSAQLYALPSVLYWQSCSRLRDAVANAGLEPMCGYAVSQGRPFDVVITDGTTSVTIDYDEVIQDFNGRVPIGVAS